MQELNAIELAGRLSEVRVTQKNEREAKQGTKSSSANEKSPAKKERDAIKTRKRRSLEETLLANREEKELERLYE